MRRERRSARTARYTAKVEIVQMDVAEGNRDLQRQRRQRQQRTTPLMAMNEVHFIPTTTPKNMLALPQYLTRGKGSSLHLVEDKSR